MSLTRCVGYRTVAGLMLAAALGCPAFVVAGGLSISPVVIEIDSPRKAIAVTVTNNGDRALTFQTDVMVWRQVNGVDQYEPTDALLVVPPIVEVPANGTQVFRLVLRVPTPSPTERTYRLVLEDISDELAPSGQASVAFKMAHNLPVMVAPTGKIANRIRWKPCATPSAMATAKPEGCVRLLNVGNRRIKVQGLTLAGAGWKQVLPVPNGINVLAGAEREWRFPIEQGPLLVVNSVQVQTARGETLQAEPDGF